MRSIVISVGVPSVSRRCPDDDDVDDDDGADDDDNEMMTMYCDGV